MSSGKSGQQKVAENITGQRGAQMQSDLGQQSALTGAAQSTLGQFEGPVQQSGLYKNLLNTGIEQTSGAYDAARSNLLRQGNMAGFGYNQPVTQGAEAQLGSQEAQTMSRLPREAAIAATGPALQAAGQTGQMGMGYGNQALDFGGQQLGANQQAAQLQAQRNAQNSALWSALAGITGDVLGGPIGGMLAGKLTGAATGGGGGAASGWNIG